jgi:molybdopterin synthase sulfur carrier subunit
MRVRLLYFARVAEITGRPGEEIELPDGATAGDALAAAAQRHAGMGAPGFAPLLAVNRRHAGPREPLSDGDEVAIFPPVSGG